MSEIKLFVVDSSTGKSYPWPCTQFGESLVVGDLVHRNESLWLRFPEEMSTHRGRIITGHWLASNELMMIIGGKFLEITQDKQLLMCVIVARTGEFGSIWLGNTNMTVIDHAK